MEAVAVPAPGTEPPIADLSPGEVRLVARLEDRADSNTILVKRASEGGYVAVNEAPWSMADPTRGQWGPAGAVLSRRDDALFVYASSRSGIDGARMAIERVARAIGPPCRWKYLVGRDRP
jgi:hypothetical protein